MLWTSILSLYYSDGDSVGEAIDWHSLSLYLESEVFPGAGAQANSPLLASNWRLYRIIVEVVHLSHGLPLDRSSRFRGEELEIELNRRENEVREDM